MRFSNRLAFILLLGAFGLVGSSWADDDTSVDMLRQYFDYLATGNVESAQLMWTESAQERSARFGIEYDGIMVRSDAASPVIQNFDVMRNFLEPPVRQMEAMPGDTFQRLTFSAIVGSESIKYTYYAKRDQRWFWLSFPQDYWTRDWPVQESKYLRIHVHPRVKEFLSPALLNEVDRFVAAMADTLKLPKASLAEIAARKIEWYYCDGDQTVEEITGFKTKGMLDLGSNSIISSTFPHYHELVHLLVNIRLKKIPLHTLPLLREGIAVRYGGRWGKSLSALSDLGAYLYKEKLVELDSILVDKGYEAAQDADIIYPVAGIFSSFLLDRIGIEGYLTGYRSLSGSGAQLRALKPDSIKKALATMGGFADWNGLVTGFDAYLAKASGTYAVAAPGRVADGKLLLAGDGYSIVQSKDWLGFEFSLADTVTPHGTLLFAPLPAPGSMVSSLFVEHFSDVYPYEGYRYGVRYDQNEAGLYDYVTNQLIAKYIWGITPSDDYYSKGSRTVAIKFKKVLLGKDLPVKGQVKLLPM